MNNAPTLDNESRLIVDSIPGVVALLSATGEVEVVNPQLLAYFGQTLEELKQWGTNGTVHPEDLPHVAEVFTTAISSGTPYEIVQRLRRADGVYRWMENRGYPLRDPNGRITRWCVLLTDVDKRKRAEDALQQNEQNLKLIIDSIPALVWNSLPDGSAEFFNQHYLDYVGMTSEQAMGWRWTSAVHPDDLQDLGLRWQEILASEQPGEAEARLRRHDGEYRWFLFRANPFRDATGKIVKWYGQNTDIEDRKRAQEGLAANERYLRSIINTIPTHIYVLNTEGSVQHVNQGVMDYTGLTLEDVQQEDYRDRVIHPEDFKRVRAPRAAGLRRGAPFSTEQRVLGADGQYRWFLVHYKPLLDEQGSIVRWYVAAFDIEDRKRGEFRLKESQRQFKTIFDEAGTGITLVDLKTGEPIRNNRALQKMLGCSEEELGRFETYDRLTHVDDREKDSATFRELCDGKFDSLKIEKHFVLKDGRSIWANVIFTLLRGEDGRPRYIIAIHEDITERKQTEETFRTIVETNPECVKVITRDGTLKRVNAAGVAMAGVPSEETILGQCFYDFLAPEDRDRYREFNEAVCSGHKGFLEFDIINARGERRQMETHAAPMLNSDGSVVQLGVTRDITDRKRVVEILKAKQDLVELAQKSAGAMAFDWQIQEEINVWSPEQEALYGLAPGSFDGTYLGWKDLIYPPDWTNVLEAISHAHETGDVAAEFRVIWPDGSVHWLSTNGKMFFDEEGKPFRMVGFTSDVTRRKLVEEELRRSEAFLAEGQYLAQIGNFAWNLETNKITWSDQLYRIYEIEQGTPVTLDLIRTRVHPEDVSLFEKMVEKANKGGDDFEWQYRLLMPDGSIKYMHSVAHAAFDRDNQREYIAAVQDVTSRRLSQEALDEARAELAQAARVMSLGVLTASIAHEVNQPLSGIITNASTCVRMLDADPPNVDGARETARRTIRDGNRASEVITRLRALFGRKEFTPESIDLNEAALEVIALSGSELQRSQVVLQTDLAKGIPLVDGDRVQLQQVILNLLLNAADAMSSVTDGPRQLTIATGPDGDAGVQVKVRDVGVGFAGVDAERLFEAFYTTKKSGMGIGLSVSKSIIENHRGRLWAAPNNGPGATFCFSIPCADPDTHGTLPSGDLTTRSKKENLPREENLL